MLQPDELMALVNEVFNRLMALERSQTSLSLAGFGRCFLRLSVHEQHAPRVSSGLDLAGVVPTEPDLNVA